MVEQKVLEDFVQGLKPEQKDTNTVHTAIVSNIDDEGVVWVNINGSDKETPTELVATEVKRGDAVTVQWRNNKLYVASNYTNPSAGVVRVSAVEAAAQTAQSAANNAVADADRAKEAAEDAIATAESVHSIAQQAAEDAAEAKTSATNASEYASRALGNLSTVQSVTETLNWITQHGTMTLTTDTALDPSHVYFILDPNGDYMVSGNKYRVVTEPKVADIATYYELSIDESLNNYVATHLAVDSEGLWILPDSGGNKVLIATGQGQTYTAAGTYIVSGSDILAEFTANGAQIGQDSESHLNMDYHSMQLIDKEGNAYFHVSDLRDSTGFVEITEARDAGHARIFLLGFKISSIVSVKINGVETTEFTWGNGTASDGRLCGIVTFNSAPGNQAVLTFVYLSDDDALKAYTFGYRDSTVSPGGLSVVEGYNNTASGFSSHSEGGNNTASGYASHAEGYSTTASGYYSHAEGQETTASASNSHAEGHHTTASGYASHAEGHYTTASGEDSHAEGHHTTASGSYSHAQNNNTIAQRKSQTALGEFNIADTGGTDETTRGDYALIIGNGTNNNRSNALTVDWNGVPVGHNSNGTEIDYEISDATIALYDQLAGGTGWRE